MTARAKFPIEFCARHIGSLARPANAYEHQSQYTEKILLTTPSATKNVHSNAPIFAYCTLRRRSPTRLTPALARQRRVRGATPTRFPGSRAFAPHAPHVITRVYCHSRPAIGTVDRVAFQIKQVSPHASSNGAPTIITARLCEVNACTARTETRLFELCLFIPPSSIKVLAIS